MRALALPSVLETADSPGSSAAPKRMSASVPVSARGEAAFAEGTASNSAVQDVHAAAAALREAQAVVPGMLSELVCALCLQALLLEHVKRYHRLRVNACFLPSCLSAARHK